MGEIIDLPQASSGVTGLDAHLHCLRDSVLAILDDPAATPAIRERAVEALESLDAIAATQARVA